MAEERRARMPWLSVLRAGSAVLVIVIHCTAGVVADPGLLGTPVWWICNAAAVAGRTGLAMFFVLSGALLLPDERTREIGPFYRRRLPRILVPLLCWDVIYFLEGVLLGSRELSLGLFLTELLAEKGSKYHLWFLYKLVSLYLLLPFFKRMADGCTRREKKILLLVILLPASILPMADLLPRVSVDLFSPPMEGRLGYFLLGALLMETDPASLRKRTRVLLYAAGAAGLVLNTLGNYWCSSPGRVDLRFSGGCTLTYYIACAAAFLLCRELLEGRTEGLRGRLAAVAEHLAPLTYGIYLCHPLFLDLAAALTANTGLGTARGLAVQFLFTALCAVAASWILGRERHLRGLLITGPVRRDRARLP